MAYKEKECPKCGTKHTKRGEYCSRSCGNSRAPTREHKAKIAEAKKEWHATSDVAAVVAHNYVSKGLNKDPEPVGIPSRTPLESNQFVSDGDLWEIAN
jgi:hypothetical protein